jgi:hypothetical protein
MFYIFKIDASFGDSEKVEKAIREIISYFKTKCVVDASNDLLTLLLSTSPQQMRSRARRDVVHLIFIF